MELCKQRDVHDRTTMVICTYVNIYIYIYLHLSIFYMSTLLQGLVDCGPKPTKSQHGFVPPTTEAMGAVVANKVSKQVVLTHL